jgi:SAM-dependent methyltransferase
MSQPAERDREGASWQRGIWDRYPEIYQREVDPRFAPVVEHVIQRAALAPGQDVLDLGTGTGAVALRAAPLVAPDGVLLGVDISSEMLDVARRRATTLGATNVSFEEGRAEAIPAAEGRFHVVLASLSLMYAIDRAAAAREIARVCAPAAGSSRRCGLRPSSATLSYSSRPPAALRPRPQSPASGLEPSRIPRLFCGSWPTRAWGFASRRRHSGSILTISLRPGRSCPVSPRRSSPVNDSRRHKRPYVPPCGRMAMGRATSATSPS